jgi:hypothetical protein
MRQASGGRPEGLVVENDHRLAGLPAGRPGWSGLSSTAYRYGAATRCPCASSPRTSLATSICRVLKTQGCSRAKAHFLGAVVFKMEDFVTGVIEVREVIDGQERLSTVLILIKALRDLCSGEELDDVRDLESLLFNDLGRCVKDDDRFKLLPNNVDRQPFLAVMNAAGPAELPPETGPSGEWSRSSMHTSTSPTSSTTAGICADASSTRSRRRSRTGGSSPGPRLRRASSASTQGGPLSVGSARCWAWDGP